MKKKRKKKGNNKLEKFIYKSFVLTTVILIVGIIYSRASLGKINLEVQELSGIIKNESEDNQSLVMKINEMVSLDKIQEVSSELGLTYNNDNTIENCNTGIAPGATRTCIIPNATVGSAKNAYTKYSFFSFLLIS